jgi:hypothetical protein
MLLPSYDLDFLKPNFQANITASGNVSASGTIVGSNLSGTNTGDQDLSPYAQTVNVVANSATASFIVNSQTSSMSVLTSSFAVTASHALNTTIIPTGTVSGSGQITQLGFVTSSATASFVVNSSTASFAITGSNVLFGNITGSNISASGVYTGDGSGLTNIPASGIIGLSLFKIASGSATASISPDKGLEVNTSISGSVISGSAGHFTGDLMVLGTASITTLHTVYETASIIYASGSTKFGDTMDDTHIRTGSLFITGSTTVVGGTYTGDGAGLTNIPASGITGLNLSRIASGSVTASIAPDKGFEINTNITASGNISSSADITSRFVFVDSYIKNNSNNNTLFGFSAANTIDLQTNSAVRLRITDTGANFNSGHITASGNVSSSATSTASFGTYLGDGSQLDGVQAFPFSGSAIITGSLEVSQSVVDFTSASAVLLPGNATQVLISPIVEYTTAGAITASGVEIPLPNNLTYVSSSTFEFLEIFINGLRLRYNLDFVPFTTSSVKYNIAIPSGSEVTYKSIKQPT